MSALAEPLRKQRPPQEKSDFPAMIVRLRPQTRLDNAALVEFCADNSELRVEQNAQGDLIIMAPAWSESGWQNAELTADFVTWARKAGGRVFDSSSGFKLPNGALRSPDVSWISQGRLDEITPEGWREFIQLCPDLVLELRSRSDRLATLQQKMAEYMANGARLGWLIDPAGRQVFVCQPVRAPLRLDAPEEIEGGEVIPRRDPLLKINRSGLKAHRACPAGPRSRGPSTPLHSAQDDGRVPIYQFLERTGIKRRLAGD